MMSISSRKRKYLVLGVLFSLSLGYNGQAAAQSSALVTGAGRPMFTVTYFDEGEDLPGKGATPLIEPAPFTLTNDLKSGAVAGLSYWSEMLGKDAKNPKALQTFISTVNDQNAYAASCAYINGEYTVKETLKDSILNGSTIITIDPKLGMATEGLADGNTGYYNIYIGTKFGDINNNDNFGWWIDSTTPLPTNEAAADYIGTVRHEMGHALGISVNYTYLLNDQNEPTEFKFVSLEEPDSWNAHLVDQNGNKAKPEMKIITSAEFDDLQESDPDLKASDFFILDEKNDGENPTSGKAYFVGGHVSDVLAGAKFDGMDGLPVNGWENGKPELSHLQTTGMMSHRSYSNYTSFMEAELAVMQDMGYQLDRKAYFGYSVYGDGGSITNRNGYSARNEAATDYIANAYSRVPLGVGLHIYGSQNKITQVADILTVGDGAVGIRVDGAGNKLTVAKDTQVHADGNRGMGLLVSYGSGHTVDQYGTVTAMGQGGNGVQFDFGSSSNGAFDEYRGSYIRYLRALNKDGYIMYGRNGLFSFENGEAAPELNGALAKEYNLYGTLAGAQNAMYISRNAFVQAINIQNGAQVQGDITSEWKHFESENGIYDGPTDEHRGQYEDADKVIHLYPNEPLRIQYNGEIYNYSDYIPDLVTKLNFDADMDYTGNINGADNMKLFVKGHRLNYGGVADVVAVDVAEGASLRGGIYNLHQYADASPTVMRYSLADNGTGLFSNSGTIGAAVPSVEQNSVMLINGDLQLNQGSKIAFSANRDSLGLVQVSGSIAGAADSSLVIDSSGVYTPNKRYDTNILQAKVGTSDTESYAPAITADTMAYKTGMLNTTKAGTDLLFTPGDNLGSKTVSQSTMFTSIGKALAANGSLAEAYAPLYNLQAADAKVALQAAYGGLQSDAANLVKQDGFTREAVWERLGVADSHENLWGKLSRSWQSFGNSDIGRSSVNSFSVAVGTDRQYSDKWQAGVLMSYGKHNLHVNSGKTGIDDVRLGVYGRYGKANEMYVAVMADYGLQHYDGSRQVIGGTAQGKYDSDTYSVGLRVGRDYDLKDAWQVKPYLGADYTNYHLKSMTEHGVLGYNLSARGQDTAVTAAVVGVKAVRTYTNGSFNVEAGCRHLLNGEDAPLQLTLADSGIDYTSAGNSYAKTMYYVKLGGSAKLAQNVTLSGEVNKSFGTDYQGLNAWIHAGWSF